MPSTGFNPVTPAIGRQQTYSLDGTEAEVGPPARGLSHCFIVFVVISLEFFGLTVKQ
jgi:hypothetical protein